MYGCLDTTCCGLVRMRCGCRATGTVGHMDGSGSKATGGNLLIDNHADSFPLLTGAHTDWKPKDEKAQPASGRLR